MKLLTKKIEKRLKSFPLCSQEGLKNEAVVICKFFSPIGPFTWYVTEGEEVEVLNNETGNTEFDYHFFG